MNKEYFFSEAMRAYKKGAVIESCLTKTKYRMDLETSKHMKKSNIDEDFYPCGNISINEINSKWFIEDNNLTEIKYFINKLK